MKWMLSNIGSSKSMEALKAAISKAGHDFIRLPESDLFRDTLDKTIPAKYPEYDNIQVFYYGSISCCDKVKQDRPDWVRFYHQDKMTCQYYYKIWKDLLVNQDYIFIKMQDIFNNKNALFETFGQMTHGVDGDATELTDNAVFIRPDANNKCFTGRLVFQSKFERFTERMELMDMSVKPDTLCVVAKPVVLDCEYRCLIHRGKYITGSKYHQMDYEHGEIILDYQPVPQDVIDYVNTVPAPCDDLYPIYILDIARLSSGELKVLEMGSAHCVGLYDCIDLDKFVEVIAKEMEG